MPNGKYGDNPLTDMTIHGRHPFPPDIELLLRRIDDLGRKLGRWPLGENWPYSAQEFEWERHPEVGETVTSQGRVAADVERRGMRFITFETDVTAGGTPVCRSRALFVIRGRTS